MKKIGFIKNTIYSIGLSLLIVVAVVLFAGKFGIGGIRALVVQSGSMEPKIMTKSVVITVPSSFYGENDVITFKQSGRENVLVTHRIENTVTTPNGNEFVTKGDANEEADGETVPAGDVIGKVVFTIPFIGILVSFAQTQIGFLILVIIPAVAIVYSELLNIKNQIVKFYVNRKGRRLVRPLK